MDALSKVNASRPRSSIEEGCSQRHTETLKSLEDELTVVRENERHLRDELALLGNRIGRLEEESLAKDKRIEELRRALTKLSEIFLSAEEATSQNPYKEQMVSPWNVCAVAKEKRGVVSRQGIGQPTKVNLGSMEGRGGEENSLQRPAQVTSQSGKEKAVQEGRQSTYGVQGSQGGRSKRKHSKRSTGPVVVARKVWGATESVTCYDKAKAVATDVGPLPGNYSILKRTACRRRGE